MEDKVDTQLIEVENTSLDVNSSTVDKEVNSIIRIFKNKIENNNKLLTVSINMNKCIEHYIKYEC